jgi:hypothetical protein
MGSVLGSICGGFEQPSRAHMSDANPSAMNFMKVIVLSLQNRQNPIDFSVRS